jgi:protein phosphatase
VAAPPEDGDYVYDDGDGDGNGRHVSRRSRRRFTWRVALFTLVLLAVVGGAIATIQWYGRSAYFVGLDGDRVAIFKGRPGGLLWIEPTLVETSDLDIDRVPEAGQHDIEAGKEQPSLADARHYVDNVAERADELDPPATTTTATTVPPTTTTLAPPAAPA